MANLAEDDSDLSETVDGYIHYAMAFVNPQGVELVMNTKRGGTMAGFTYVNKEAEEKRKKAMAGEVITPKNNPDIAERIKRRRGKTATLVNESKTEVEV